MIHEEHVGARHWQKQIGLFFSTLNKNCLAENRPRELKLGSLELESSENEDSEYSISLTVFLASS